MLMSDRNTSTPLRNLWAQTHFWVFVCAWLIPTLYCGITNYRYKSLPNEMNIFYRLAGLFTRRTQSWYQHYIQVSLEGVDGKWITVDMLDYDKMSIYGYSNRIERMIGLSAGNGKRGEAMRQRIADYIGKRHARIFPGSSPVSYVRFILARWQVGETEYMKRPPGRWVRMMPLELVPNDRKMIMSSHKLSLAEQRLRVSGDKLNDETLTRVLRSQKVEILDLSQSNITAVGLAEVWQHKSLIDLSLKGRRLSPADWEGLSKLTNLRALNLSGTSGVSRQNFERLSNLRELVKLDLSNVRLSNDLEDSLKKIQNLQQLNLNQTGIGARLLKELEAWPRLTDLYIAGSPDVRLALSELKEHSSLRHLDLSRTEVKESDLLNLKRLPSLYRLFLDHTQLGNGEIGSLKFLPSLRLLSIDGSQIAPNTLSKIGREDSVTHIRMKGEWHRTSGLNLHINSTSGKDSSSAAELGHNNVKMVGKSQRDRKPRPSASAEDSSAVEATRSSANGVLESPR